MDGHAKVGGQCESVKGDGLEPNLTVIWNFECGHENERLVE